MTNYHLMPVKLDTLFTKSIDPHLTVSTIFCHTNTNRSIMQKNISFPSSRRNRKVSPGYDNQDDHQDDNEEKNQCGLRDEG